MDGLVYSKNLTIKGQLTGRTLAQQEKKKIETENYVENYLKNNCGVQILIVFYSKTGNNTFFTFLVRLYNRTKVTVFPIPGNLGKEIEIAGTRNLQKEYQALLTTSDHSKFIIGSEKELSTIYKPDKEPDKEPALEKRIDDLQFMVENLINRQTEAFLEEITKITCHMNNLIQDYNHKQQDLGDQIYKMMDYKIDIIEERTERAVEKAQREIKDLLKAQTTLIDSQKQEIPLILKEHEYKRKTSIEQLTYKLNTLEVKQTTQFDSLKETIKHTKDILEYSNKYIANKSEQKTWGNLHKMNSNQELTEKSKQVNELTQNLNNQTHEINLLREELKTYDEMVCNKNLKLQEYEMLIIEKEEALTAVKIKDFIKSTIDSTIDTYFSNVNQEYHVQEPHDAFNIAYDNIYQQIITEMETRKVNMKTNDLYDVLGPYLKDKLVTKVNIIHKQLLQQQHYV